MVSGVERFPMEATSPGRASACAGVRAFLHRMVACLGPTGGSQADEDNKAAETLLVALVKAVPPLVQLLRAGAPVVQVNGWDGSDQRSTNSDAELRWREIRDIMPLIIQVVTRYKVCTLFLVGRRVDC